MEADDGTLLDEPCLAGDEARMLGDDGMVDGRTRGAGRLGDGEIERGLEV